MEKKNTLAASASSVRRSDQAHVRARTECRLQEFLEARETQRTRLPSNGDRRIKCPRIRIRPKCQWRCWAPSTGGRGERARCRRHRRARRRAGRYVSASPVAARDQRRLGGLIADGVFWRLGSRLFFESCRFLRTSGGIASAVRMRTRSGQFAFVNNQILIANRTTAEPALQDFAHASGVARLRR